MSKLDEIKSTQDLLDTVYEEFTAEVVKLKLKADTPAVTVVSELTRALKRVVNKHGATAMTVEGKKYTNRQLEEMEG